MRVAIVKYNAGNVQSVLFALKRLGVDAELTDDPGALQAADRVIFPGVGEAGSAMAYLRERALHEVIPQLTQPVLGICLGLQLLCEWSEEADTTCMGVFPHRVRKFPAAASASPKKSPGSTPRQKVPQIGWNTVQHDGRGVFDGLPPDPYMYFVHSYYAEDGPCTAATTEYMLPFASALRKDNFHAVQFHPEKSAEPGSRLLEKFLQIAG